MVNSGARHRHYRFRATFRFAMSGGGGACFGSTRGDNGMRRQWRMQPGCGSGYVLAIGIGGTHDRAGGFSRTPLGLFSTLWIPGNAEATGRQRQTLTRSEGADIVARTM
jgi:hypothetical protein